MYLFILLTGFLALALSFYTGLLDMSARAGIYRRKIRRRLLVRGPKDGRDLTCDLWSTTYVIGRMQSKCDLCLSGDRTVSRIHAIMLYTGETYRIKPICHTSASRPYVSKVYVNDIRVPVQGTLLEDGDEIQLGNTVIRYLSLKKGKARDKDE